MSKATKSPSEKRLAANRANAARSTGPRTPEGKVRSAQNLRKPTFNPAAFPIARVVELDSIAKQRADAIATYQPVNSQERFAVERIALTRQSLLLCAAIESGFLTGFRNGTIARDVFPPDMLTVDIQAAHLQKPNLCLAAAAQRVLRKSGAWYLFVRYQAQTERLLRSAIKDFERLKNLRAELPNEAKNEAKNEPISKPKIEEIAPRISCRRPAAASELNSAPAVPNSLSHRSAHAIVKYSVVATEFPSGPV